MAKVPQTVELVEGVVEQGKKALVFTSFDASARALRDHFGDAVQPRPAAQDGTGEGGRGWPDGIRAA